MGAKIHKNVVPRASQKAARKHVRKSFRKGSHFDCPDLPKPWKGHQKSRFSGFQQKYQKRPPKASVLEAFWAPKSYKTVSRRVPENHRKNKRPKVGPRVEKGSQKGTRILVFLVYFSKPAPGRASGTPPGWLWKGLGTIFEGCSTLFSKNSQFLVFDARCM